MGHSPDSCRPASWSTSPMSSYQLGKGRQRTLRACCESYRLQAGRFFAPSLKASLSSCTLASFLNLGHQRMRSLMCFDCSMASSLNTGTLLPAHRQILRTPIRGSEMRCSPVSRPSLRRHPAQQGTLRSDATLTPTCGLAFGKPPNQNYKCLPRAWSPNTEFIAANPRVRNFPSFTASISTVPPPG